MSIQPQSIQIENLLPEEDNKEKKVTNFGDYLRKQRMLRGVTHEEITQITKVRLTFIEALERNDFQSLPPKTFVVGFLKAMAKYLGLDEEDLVTRYLVATQEADEKTEVNVVLKSPKIIQKKFLRIFAWFTGAVVLFFVITLPHFLKN